MEKKLNNYRTAERQIKAVEARKKSSEKKVVNKALETAMGLILDLKNGE